MNVTSAQLIVLRNHALKIGTLDQWSIVAIEWMQAAEVELAKRQQEINNLRGIAV